LSRSIEVRPVLGGRQRRSFLTFPWRIYAGDPLWVPPLLPERRRFLNPRRGPFFRHGEAELFTAWRGGRPVGTICAAEDTGSNRENNNRECIFGFFECVNDYDVARCLLDHAALWGSRRGLDRLAGPFNLDYEDGYGVLIEGRDRPPALLCAHSPPYYQEFLERYGLRPFRGDNLAYAVELAEDSPQIRRLARLAEHIRRRRCVRIRTPDLTRWQEEVDVVHGLLNRALAHLPDYRPWPRASVESLLGAFRRVADPELVLFAEVDGRTVGWFPGVPNLNEVFIRVNGLRYPWDYLRLAAQVRRRPECVSIKSVLVLPEYWRSGVAVLLFDEMARRARARGYRWADLSLTSEDNPFTPALATRMGACLYKRYRVYRLPIGGAAPGSSHAPRSSPTLHTPSPGPSQSADTLARNRKA
jgi:GNAT superfamily N-acetyltransferase